MMFNDFHAQVFVLSKPIFSNEPPYFFFFFLCSSSTNRQTPASLCDFATTFVLLLARRAFLGAGGWPGDWYMLLC